MCDFLWISFPASKVGFLLSLYTTHRGDLTHTHTPSDSVTHSPRLITLSIDHRQEDDDDKKKEEGGGRKGPPRRSPVAGHCIYLLIFADVCRDPVQADGHPVAYMAGRSNQTDFHASSSITHASSSLSQEVTHSNLKLETRLWVNCEEVPGGSSFPMGASPRIFNPSGPFQPCIQLSSPQPWCEYGGSIGRELPL